MSRTRLPLLVGLFLILVVPACVVAALRTTAIGPRPAAAPETQEIVNETPPGAIPKLTAEDIRVARAVFASDPYVARLLAGHPHRLVGPGVWHAGRTKLGAFIHVEYVSRAAFDDAQIPIIPFDQERNRFAPASASVVQRFSGVLWGLGVSVDLKGKRVADISPLGKITERPPVWENVPPSSD